MKKAHNPTISPLDLGVLSNNHKSKENIPFRKEAMSKMKLNNYK